MNVLITGGDLSEAEVEAYKKHAREKYPGDPIEQLDIHIDGDYVDLSYHFGSVPFDRIRRITGYLVGTLDRFNDAKYAEVNDRVKHGGLNNA